MNSTAFCHCGGYRFREDGAKLRTCFRIEWINAGRFVVFDPGTVDMLYPVPVSQKSPGCDFEFEGFDSDEDSLGGSSWHATVLKQVVTILVLQRFPIATFAEL